MLGGDTLGPSAFATIDIGQRTAIISQSKLRLHFVPLAWAKSSPADTPSFSPPNTVTLDAPPFQVASCFDGGAASMGQSANAPAVFFMLRVHIAPVGPCTNSMVALWLSK